MSICVHKKGYTKKKKDGYPVILKRALAISAKEHCTKHISTLHLLL